MDFAREGGSHGARRRARKFFPGFVQERSPMLRAELTGEPERIDSFIADMSVHGIAELSRSGITALESGDTVIND